MATKNEMGLMAVVALLVGEEPAKVGDDNAAGDKAGAPNAKYGCAVWYGLLIPA